MGRKATVVILALFAAFVLAASQDNNSTCQPSTCCNNGNALNDVKANLQNMKELHSADVRSLNTQLTNTKSELRLVKEKLNKLYMDINCPTGYSGRFSSACYKFVRGSENWATARQRCQADNTDLATIESAAENNYVRNYIKSNSQLRSHGGYWIGVTDNAQEGKWVSAATGVPVSFTGWNRGEPNGGQSENCVHLFEYLDFNWNDYRCGNSNGYICKKQI